MGKYLPLGLKITFCACLGVLGPCVVVLFADVPSNSHYSGKCCRPNAKNYGYWETQWREWPCDQRPEKVFPGAVGNEVVPAPAGQVQAPLPKATVLPTKPETPGGAPESPTTPEQPEGTPLPGEGTRLPGEGARQPGEGMRLPGAGTNLPGGGMRLPGGETPAEGAAPKTPGKSPESATPAPNKPAPEGSLQGLQPESPLPPGAKEGPVAPLPSGSKDGEPVPANPAPPAPNTEGTRPPAKPEDFDAPKAPLPGDGTMRPVEKSQVVKAEALVPVEEDLAPMPARADWISPQPAQPDAKSDLPAAASPVSDVATEAPVALAGYCPVTLADEERWVRGDPRWSVVYGGRTFLLSGPEQQQRFLSAAERYLPAFAGDDAVQAVEGGAHVAGSPQHSVFCGGKVYLFSSAESLSRFQQAPHRYAAAKR